MSNVGWPSVDSLAPSAAARELNREGALKASEIQDPMSSQITESKVSHNLQMKRNALIETIHPIGIAGVDLMPEMNPVPGPRAMCRDKGIARLNYRLCLRHWYPCPSGQWP
jgi:hypothetical protein